MQTGKFFQRSEDVQRCGIAIGILAGRERLRLLPFLATGEIGDQLEQRVRRGAEREGVREHVTERSVADAVVGRCTERGDHRSNERRIVRADTPRTSCRPCSRSRSPSDRSRRATSLSPIPACSSACAKGTRPRRRANSRVTPAAGATTGAIFAAGAAAGAPSSSSYSVFSMRAVSLPPGTQRFRRASFSREQHIRIVGAIVAALAAILLRHRGHHPATQRTPFGELHAFGKRDRLIVPWRVAIVFGRGRGACTRQRERRLRERRC